MKVGWIGLGKLGLPCALVLADSDSHEVVGYDVSGLPQQILSGEVPPMQEQGIGKLLKIRNLRIVDSVAVVVQSADVIFVAVQTPHAPAYGGEEPMPDDRRDFEYAYLVQACRDVCQAAAKQRKAVTLVVVSTVLPGTTGRLVRPLLNRYVRLIYSPQFIAMGTTIRDFLNPEFVICGVDDEKDALVLEKVFIPLHGDNKLFVTSIETAEAIKVFYNVFISTKIVFANTVMEVCHKTGADCDQVHEALSRATERVISPKYLKGGMGDGGACHPRDLIAMSWLAQRLDLSHDMLGQMVTAREAQTRWLADLVRSYHEQTGLSVIILGKAYKPGSDLTSGSPALLLAYYLKDVTRLQQWDPHVDTDTLWQVRDPAVFVIAAQHPEFYDGMDFPQGSVVIDPFGECKDRPGVTVIRVGRK